MFTPCQKNVWHQILNDNASITYAYENTASYPGSFNLKGTFEGPRGYPLRGAHNQPKPA
jgi:hypothetical protein